MSDALQIFDNGAGHPSPDKLRPYDFTPEQVEIIRQALQSKPDGFVMVPIEPTKEMVIAMATELALGHPVRFKVEDLYSAAIKASQEG